MKRGVRREAIVRGRLEDGITPFHEARCILVRYHHPLGFPGRTGGVQDIGQTVFVFLWRLCTHGIATNTPYRFGQALWA